VQHFASAQARCWQSAPLVHPCPSRQLFEQFPLHAGPQQRCPEHAPVWQSWLSPQTLESGHLTPHLLPQRLVKSLGVQHVPLIQAPYLPQSPSTAQVCAEAVAGAASPSVRTARTAGAATR
jgi:hypothetical protein